MTRRNELIELLTNEYIEKILGFAYIKTADKTQAEDLTQDICTELIKIINSGKDIKNFNAFVWKVTNNLFYKWFYRKKKNNFMYLTGLEESAENIEGYYEEREEKLLLLREISLLSKIYREVVLMHYFDGKSCLDIANLKNVKEGTVKWWLYDARKYIKKGMIKMREYGEKSYRPGKLHIGTQGVMGENREPTSLVKHKIHQNILLAAYKQPQTISQLSLELGISSPYIEDAVDFLCENQVLKKASKDYYQTDFIIMSRYDLAKVIVELNEAFGDDYYNILIDYLKKNRNYLENYGYNVSGFSWERLLWIYIFLFENFAYSNFKHLKNIGKQDLPERPYGGKWLALGFEDGDKNSYMEIHNKDFEWDGPLTIGNENGIESGYVTCLAHYWSGCDNQWLQKIPYKAFSVYIKTLKANMSTCELTDIEKELLLSGINNGFFIEESGKLKQNFLYLCPETFYKLRDMAKELNKELNEIYNQSYNLVEDRFVKIIPNHVQNQAQNYLSIIFRYFATFTLSRAYNNKLLSKPDEKYKHLLSLYVRE